MSTRRPSSLRRAAYGFVYENMGNICGVLLLLAAGLMMLERAR